MCLVNPFTPSNDGNCAMQRPQLKSGVNRPLFGGDGVISACRDGICNACGRPMLDDDGVPDGCTIGECCFWLKVCAGIVTEVCAGIVTVGAAMKS